MRPRRRARPAPPRRPPALLLGLAAVLSPLGPAGGTAVLGAADRTPPVVEAPVAAPGTGTRVGPAAAPLWVSWAASDAGGSGIEAVRLQMSVDGGSWATVTLPSPIARHTTVSLRPPHEARFRVRARDRAGNRSEWAYGTSTRVSLRAEDADGTTRTGTWAGVTGAEYLDDRAVRSRQAGAELTLVFTGTQVAWVGRRSPSGGSADVYLDGVRRTTVSTYGTLTSERRIEYVATWPEPDTHTITIRVLGTPGHPDVLVDGFIVGDPQPADPVLVGAGDIAQCGDSGDNETARLLDGIPGRVFVAGDSVYPSGTATQYRDCYDPTWGRHRLRTSPAVGNHEYLSVGAGPYWDYFGSRAGERGKGWYAYDLGTWRVYSLNSNCGEVGCEPGSEQHEWLRADLAANRRACVAAVMHHPLFSSGDHGGNPSVRPLWDALGAAGADVVLADHDHSYERFEPQTPSGDADPAGIRLFVVGTGGVGLRSFPDVQPNSVVRDASANGVLAMTLRPDGYSWRFVAVPGEAFTDVGAGDCH